MRRRSDPDLTHPIEPQCRFGHGIHPPYRYGNAALMARSMACGLVGDRRPEAQRCPDLRFCAVGRDLTRDPGIMSPTPVGTGADLRLEEFVSRPDLTPLPTLFDSSWPPMAHATRHLARALQLAELAGTGVEEPGVGPTTGVAEPPDVRTGLAEADETGSGANQNPQ